MATDKTFKVAGISKLNGDYKVRFANDIMRIKVLAKSGHEDIRLAELDKESTKLEAAAELLAMDEFQDAIAQSTITEYIDENSPKAPKATPATKAKVSKPVAKATKTPATKVAKAVKAPTADMDENIPF